MILYDQRAAERFGFDARIRIVCAADPQGDSAFRDRHVQQAYENARIAFHFAALVRDNSTVSDVAPPQPARYAARLSAEDALIARARTLTEGARADLTYLEALDIIRERNWDIHIEDVMEEHSRDCEHTRASHDIPTARSASSLVRATTTGQRSANSR